MVKKMTKWLYLHPFLYVDESMHLLDISRRLNQNHATVRKYLNQFQKEGLLKKQTKGTLTLYSINYDFPLLIDYLSIVEKEVLIHKANQHKILRELIRDLHSISKKNLIIFGSVVENYINAKDIDILGTEELDFGEIEKKFGKKVHYIKVDSLEKVKVALKEEVRKKHLIINCVEQVVKWINSDNVTNKKTNSV